MAAAPPVVLEVDELSLGFGGIMALDRLSFSLSAGTISGLIGPNGAGKTTLFNVLSRIYQPTSGAVRFRGEDLLAVPIHRIAALGIGRTFQNLAVFPTMSLLENVMVGAHSQGRVGLLRAICRAGSAAEDRRMRELAGDLLAELGLAHLAHHSASGLPFGTLKRLEIARALAARPSFLMLDEPASGLTHGEVEELGETIAAVKDRFRLTVLLVEHHMPLVMGLSDRVVAMAFGRCIASGTPEQVRSDEAVVTSYLGAPA